MQVFNKQIWRSIHSSLLLVIILIIATLFRTYQLFDIPLMNDELSALHRLQFQHLSELINKGIIPDGHPAFTQIFLYYYTKYVGINQPALIKLPFILAGLFSIYVTYRLLKKLFDEKVAIIVCVFMSTSQFFIMHSQTARPYAFALLFTVCFVWFLINNKIISTGVFLWLTASTHYIAGLTCVVTLGLMFVLDASFRKQILTISALAFLLYLPEWPIFIAQIKTGGVGTWLGKPTPSFLFSFGYYLSNYSICLLLLILFGIYVLFFDAGLNRKMNKQTVFVGGIFIGTFLVAYFYSILRNPVLQYPVLLFSAPFLLALSFNWVNKLPNHIFLLLLISMFGVQSYALILQRKHYEVFYHQGYSHTVNFVTKHTRQGTHLLLNGNQPFYFDYYFNRKQYEPAILHSRIDSLNYIAFEKLINEVKGDTLVVAHGFYLPHEYVAIAQKYFPKIVAHTHQAFSDVYVLTKLENTHGYSSLFHQALLLDTIFLPETKVIQIDARAKIEGDLKTEDILFKVQIFQGGELVWEGERNSNQFLAEPHQAWVFICPLLTLKNIGKVHARLSLTSKTKIDHAYLQISAGEGNSKLFGTVMPIE
ncbi:MAG: hypothetical protein ACK5UI_04380 [Bacteroidota bacterium]